VIDVTDSVNTAAAEREITEVLQNCHLYQKNTTKSLLNHYQNGCKWKPIQVGISNTLVRRQKTIFLQCCSNIYCISACLHMWTKIKQVVKEGQDIGPPSNNGWLTQSLDGYNTTIYNVWAIRECHHYFVYSIWHSIRQDIVASVIWHMNEVILHWAGYVFGQVYHLGM